MWDAANEGAPALTRRGVFSLPTLLLFAILAAFAYFLATRFDMDWRAAFVDSDYGVVRRHIEHGADTGRLGICGAGHSGASVAEYGVLGRGVRGAG